MLSLLFVVERWVNLKRLSNVHDFSGALALLQMAVTPHHLFFYFLHHHIASGACLLSVRVHAIRARCRLSEWGSKRNRWGGRVCVCMNACKALNHLKDLQDSDSNTD